MLNKLMKLKNKKGFTLVELIVVIAIIAILTAIIVPLVGRYSAQARYTTLQDAATNISSATNTALSDGNQIGVVNVTEIKGAKVNGSLTVDLGDGKTVIINNNVVDTATNDTAVKRTAKRLHAALLNTLPDNSAFIVTVKSSSVAGVIYTNQYDSTKSSDFFTTTEKTIGVVTDFDNAYAIVTGSSGADGTALGVSGAFIPPTDGTVKYKVTAALATSDTVSPTSGT